MMSTMGLLCGLRDEEKGGLILILLSLLVRTEITATWLADSRFCLAFHPGEKSTSLHRGRSVVSGRVGVCFW